MKTKPFLLATAGSTVDGRVIDEQMLTQMASSYDPATYTARLNIEHIRGFTGDGPFRAYGDVVELSTDEVEVNFNGKIETRLGLFGVLDVNDDAKQLNDAGQKLFPSIEIEPNFGGKGFAYLMGCALTDSPASIATERLQFNRSLPGAVRVQADASAALEFADAANDAVLAAGGGFLTKLGAMLDSFSERIAPKTSAPTTETAPDTPAPTSLDFAQLRPLLEQIGQEFAEQVTAVRDEFRAEADSLAVKVQQLEQVQGSTPAPGYTARPISDGNAKVAAIF